MRQRIRLPRRKGQPAHARGIDLDRIKSGLLLAGLAALMVLAGIGVAQTINSANAEPIEVPTPELKPADLFPRDQAASIATAFIVEYLTLNEEDPESRAKRLAPYLAGGASADDLGWSRHGFATVTHAAPAVVHVDAAGKTARATVYTRVVVGESIEQRWYEVPIWQDANNRLGVTGPPAPVPPPPAADNPDASRGLGRDGDLTRRLYEDLLLPFFAAWAEGDTPVLRALTVDGAEPVGLGSFELADLPEGGIIIDTEGGDVRQAQASVVLRDSAGIEFTHLYRFKVERVSSTRWLVRPPITVDRPVPEQE